MSRIILFALAAIIALAILGSVAHFLFSPWLLVPIAILAWVKLRPRRSQR